jgi:hypothetical protein
VVKLADLLDDARRRAILHANLHHRDVFIARIDAAFLRQAILMIEFSDQIVPLPIWQTEDHDTFISTQDVRECLRVDHRISQLSEWFALNEIPNSLITDIWRC